MQFVDNRLMKIAFCSCNHPKVHPYQVGWMSLAAHQPDVLLLLGDNVYVEDSVYEIVGPWRPATHLSAAQFARRLHERYALQFAVPEFRVTLACSGRVMGTVDDHDFLGNDVFVSPVTSAHARAARALHRQFIAACNIRPLPRAYPALPNWQSDEDRGLAAGLGLAQSLRVDDVKLIVLDGRSFREKPGRRASALGAAQLSWLAQELIDSQSVSIVASGSTITRGSKPGIPGSPLADYPREASLLKAFYKGQGHQVVLHLAGDLHYNELTRHEGFAEVTSSGMGTGWIPFSLRAGGNFGAVDVQAGEVRVRTFGNEHSRNYDVRLSRRPQPAVETFMTLKAPAKPPLLRPDPSTFRSGDLVWPKGDDQFVYYIAGSPQEQLWQEQRDAFVARVQADPRATPEDRVLALRVEQWSYDDFQKFPPEAADFGAEFNRPWVGHVGIIEMRGGEPWVIDATPTRRLDTYSGPSGVADQTWDDWLRDASHLQSHVWHGRLRGVSAEQAGRIVAPAREQIGKPYAFFNFDMDDTAGFYCSKLVWYAVWKGLNLSLDGAAPKRKFWLSPLQMMRSPHLDMLYIPPGRDYGVKPASPPQPP